MRDARSVMSDLAATGLTPGQMALIMELSAALTVEARPQNDEAADRRRERDREYQASKRRQNRQISAESADVADETPLDKESPQTPKKLNPRDSYISPRARKAGFVLPDHIPAEPWSGFEEMRRKIGKPMTDRARSLAINELDRLADDGWPPGDVLNHCTMNSYQGIFPPKGQKNGQHRNGPDHEWGSTVAAAESLIADLDRADRDMGTGQPRLPRPNH